MPGVRRRLTGVKNRDRDAVPKVKAKIRYAHDLGALGPLKFEKTVRFFREMCRERSPTVLTHMMRIVESQHLLETNPLAVVAAGRVILEYGYGKPDGVVKISEDTNPGQVVVHMTAEQLRQSLMDDVGPKLIEAVDDVSKPE